MKGYIHSIETLGLLDGPGIRVVVFMQGCDKRCLFCHNPDSWVTRKNLEYTPEELVKIILKYKTYFENNGGVTFSGGEPLIQKEFLIETFKLLKKENIHICLDTAGYSNSEEVLELTDLVLFDIKALEPSKYKNLVGTSIDESLEFLKLCQKLNKKMWIRQVIIPTINDTEEYIIELAEFIKKLKNIEKVELLPYHTKGAFKYENLGIKYPLSGILEMDKERCLKLNKLLNDKIKDV